MSKVFLLLILITCSTSCTNLADGLLHTPAHGSANVLYEYSITIDSFNGVTYTRDVSIFINPGDASEMRLSNDQLNWSSWVSAATSMAWILSEKSDVKTVYAEFRRDGVTISTALDHIEFIEKLLPVTYGDFDKFGTSIDVSTDGSIAIMGAEDFSYTNTSGFTYKSGCAVIYRYDGIRWNPSLLVPDAASGFDRFGASVSISGDGNIALVGSPGYNGNCGRILLYRYSSVSGTWGQVASLTGSDGSCLGNSVALSRNGGYAACAAVYGNARKGEVLLYALTGYGFSPLRTLRADDGIAEDRFGCSVSVNKDASVVVAGAEQHKVGDCTNSGTVYVFRLSNGEYEQVQVQSASPDYNYYTGCSTSVSDDGNVICAGARGASFEQGRVFVFRFNPVSKQYTQYDIVDDEGRAGDQSGYSVALSGNGSILLAGSPYADNGYEDSGMLTRYHFNGTGYIKTAEYSSTDPLYEKHLGYSAAIDSLGNVCIGGAIKDSYNQDVCGTSYVFRVP